MSERSVYQRFHGLPSMAPSTVEPFVEPDWEDSGALMGTFSEDELEEKVVALANFVRLRDPSCAEVAFAVADDLQGQGVGTRLLEQLAEIGGRGRDHDLRRRRDVRQRADAARVRGRGLRRLRRLESGTTEVRLAIAPTHTYRAAVDERDHVAVAASPAPFFEPRTVAVVGASTRRGSIGGELFRNILESGYTGVAYPVNPKSPRSPA